MAEANGDRVTWTYDKLYRLTREQRSGASAYAVTHSYDLAGNRLKKTDGGAATTWTYDAANQLRTQQDAAGRTTFTFDANGNQALQQAPSGRTTYAWDFENRLTQQALPSAVRNTFQYDPDGRRAQKQDSTGTTRFVWDSANVLAETDGGNVMQAEYTLAPANFGSLLSQYRSGAAQFFHFDALGSTDRLTNASGAATDNYVYDAYGSPRGGTNSSVNPFRYIGQLEYYYDTDLAQYYVRARHYNPAIARFLSLDPAATYRMSEFLYADAAPVNERDPSGLFVFVLLFLLILVVFLIMLLIVLYFWYQSLLSSLSSGAPYSVHIAPTVQHTTRVTITPQLPALNGGIIMDLPQDLVVSLYR